MHRSEDRMVHACIGHRIAPRRMHSFPSLAGPSTKAILQNIGIQVQDGLTWTATSRLYNISQKRQYIHTHTICINKYIYIYILAGARAWTCAECECNVGARINIVGAAWKPWTKTGKTTQRLGMTTQLPPELDSIYTLINQFEN